jgi:apolipoprotein N-acyltransferase
VILSEFATTRQKQRVAMVVGVAIAAVLAGGAWRLSMAMPATGTVRVRLVSNDRRGELFASDDAKAMRILGGYADAIGNLTQADVVVVPEKLVRVSDAAAPGAKELLAEAARRTRAQVIVGLEESRGRTRRNEALVFDRNGEIQIDYEKHHFIPVLEDGYEPGTTYDTWSTPNGTLGVAICKDMDFPPLGREYGARGVGLLVVPAWDFDVDGWYHSRMAIMRGVESGYSIARVAKLGLQTVTDTRGRLLVDRVGSADGFVVSEAKVPAAHADTIYGRWGDWFAWVAIGCLAWTLWIAFGGRR